MVQGPFAGSPKGEAWRAKVEQVALNLLIRKRLN